MGTTTACYYASLHASASLILAKKVAKHGQRGLVGKVNMNCCQYDDYVETREESLKETEMFLENIQNIGVSSLYYLNKFNLISVCENDPNKSLYHELIRAINRLKLFYLKADNSLNHELEFFFFLSDYKILNYR